MAFLYRDSDANPAVLQGRTVAVLGYGNLGRAIALNLRDSGVRVIIGNNDDEYAGHARVEGFAVESLADAAASADVKWVLVPDEAAHEVYLQSVAPHLRRGDALIFSSGYNVAFGFIEPPPFVDVILIAPRAMGLRVRESFQTGGGYVTYVSVSQDSGGKAWDLLLALCGAVGGLRAGAMEVTFRQEAELDLFVQQSVLPVLHNLLVMAADMLIKEGYPPEAALTDLYLSGELGYLLNKSAEIGLMDSLKLYPQMAQYGALSRAERFQDQRMRRTMELVLEEIRSGKFAHEWASEFGNSYMRLETLRRKRESAPLQNSEQDAIDSLRDTR
jgi:ketol-acid reductoisomerase